MKGLWPALPVYAVLACTALLTACSNPGYNDNPSQQMTNARVGCPAATDFFAVYFRIRYQPPAEHQDARQRKDVFRSYCEDIPGPGKIFFTADLVGAELRRTAIGIRIVEQEFKGGDENDAENFKDLRTISEEPATTYSKGVVETHFALDKNGNYAIYLMRGGENSASSADRLRIPLKVGKQTGANLLIIFALIILGISSGLALIGFVAYWYMRRRGAL